MTSQKMSLYWVAFFLFFSFGLKSQSTLFDVKLEPISVTGLSGIQSYAFAKHNNKLLIIGGRLDGLHQRQPFASFDELGNNKKIYILDLDTKMATSYSISNLGMPYSEQFASTNIQFYQEDNFLYLVGGYAFSNTEDGHITFPYLSVVDVPTLINALENGEDTSSALYSLKDEKMAVTGGRLEKIGEKFYLVGGQRFDGAYNPMGPDHGPGFFQEYTNEVRIFEVSLNESGVEVNYDVPFHDEMHLHRRDYNLLPFMDDSSKSLMAFSGVFQPTVDLPWLYPVRVNEDAYLPIEEFNQYFNHYHSANLTIYDESNNENYFIFFGGIAQFYPEGDQIVQDNNVPFVKTITQINLDNDGQMKEVALSAQMPDYLGASSEFITADVVKYGTEDHIINFDSIGDEYTSVGYIFGGIRSSADNIFFINTGSESTANPVLYEVKVKKGISGINTNVLVNQVLDFQIYPNPTDDRVRMVVNVKDKSPLEILITNNNGQKLHNQVINKADLELGKNFLDLGQLALPDGVYYISINQNNRTRKQKLIISN